jgi:hypothetical protein
MMSGPHPEEEPKTKEVAERDRGSTADHFEVDAAGGMNVNVWVGSEGCRTSYSLNNKHQSCAFVFEQVAHLSLPSLVRIQSEFPLSPSGCQRT